MDTDLRGSSKKSIFLMEPLHAVWTADDDSSLLRFFWLMVLVVVEFNSDLFLLSRDVVVVVFELFEL